MKFKASFPNPFSPIALLLACAATFAISTAFSIGGNTESSEDEPTGVEWLSLEEAMERSKTEPRKIMVDLYTDWCGWCKRMDKNTFSNEVVSGYLNEKWYAVKFNAEQREAINFRGTEYSYKPGQNGRRGYNELAHAMTKGKMTYPTIVYLNENGEIIQAIPGYKDAYQEDKILKFFGGDHYTSTSWADFQRNYKSPMRKPGQSLQQPSFEEGPKVVHSKGGMNGTEKKKDN